VATLVTPDLWTLVGSTTIASVPAGDTLTVSDAIVWGKSSIPGQGHYCLVGLIGNAQDPAPEPSDFSDWDTFERFIRENNNVTWRNFNVVDNAPDPQADPSGYVELEFLAPGAPDKARVMQLEVTARLPRGARVFFEAPISVREALGGLSAFSKVGRKGEVLRVPANPCARTPLLRMAFPVKSRMRCRLLVHIPKNVRGRAYDVSVRQLFEDREVGRVTWRLAPAERVRAAREKRVRD
jgi:hypothetical protein